jgi:hypothetical protein
MMSQSHKPSNADPTGHGRVITEDIHCSACGYSLKGLYEGSNCPECGTNTVDDTAPASSAPRDPGSIGKPLIEGPYGYLRTLSVAFWLLTIAWGIVPVAILLTWQGLIPSSPIVVSSLLLASAVLWCAGIAISLRDRPRSIRGKRNGELIREMPQLRLIVWLMLLPVLLAALSNFLAALVANPAPYEAVAGLLAVVALAGLIPTFMYLAELAEWGSDGDLARKLRLRSWLIGPLVLLGVFLISVARYAATAIQTVPAFSGVFWFVAVVLLLVAAYLMGACVIGLVQMAHWLKTNKHQTAERERRRIEKARREAEEHKKRADAVVDPKAPEPARYDEALYEDIVSKHEASQEEEATSDPARQPRFQNEQRLDKKTDEDDPYALEEDDEDERGR